MDARLVWDTWRRILTDDQLVDWVLNAPDSGAGLPKGLTEGEIAILADYAGTHAATDSNIGMYRRGLVRNVLSALGLVPLTQQLLYASGLDVEAQAAAFVQSSGYVDDGPNFWRIAGGFIAHAAKLPELAAGSHQDVLALDAATVALARRLGKSAVEVWPERAAAIHSQAAARTDRQTARFAASRAAVTVASSHDLTAWLEDPQQYDPGAELDPSARHWLVYFPAADAAHAYAEISERSARAFNFLSAPKTAAELSSALDGLPEAETFKIIDSLAELGVVAAEGGRVSPGAKATLLRQDARAADQGETVHAGARGTSGAAPT